MKRFVGQVLGAMALVGVCSIGGAFAADTKTTHTTKTETKVIDTKSKEANAAHSDAPAVTPEGAAASGNAAGSTAATGESLQGTMSPQMTKFITSMKACHKSGKTDQKCHDRVMKSCEAKMTKDECAQVMTEVQTDNAKKM